MPERHLTALVLLLSTTLASCAPDWLATPLSDAELRFNTHEATIPAAQPETPYFRASRVFEEIPGKSGSHAPTVVALPDGHLLAAWYAYEGPGELTGSAIFSARYNHDSESWSAPKLVIDRPRGDGNPVLAAADERLWLFSAEVPGGWSTAQITQQTSLDAGETWTPPRNIDAGLGSNVRFPPVQIARGTWLLPAYSDLIPRSLFLVSRDGTTWTESAVVAPGFGGTAIQPSVAVLPDGSLLAVMRNDGADWLWVTSSTDEGYTWTRPRDAGFPNPGSPAALLRLRSARLLLVFNDSARSRTPLSVALSPDGGQSWTPSRTLVDGPGAYAYPALAQDTAGLVHVVYSHDRATIGHLTLNEAWILSSDGHAPR